MNDEFDDLDRALFALPLATPPAGMREAILRATCLMPAPAFALGRYEIAALGSFLAIFVWMLLVLVGNPERATAFNFEVSAIVSALAQPATLLWLATGASVAACFSVGLPGIGERRTRRS
jgi:hypothetical protein